MQIACKRFGCQKAVEVCYWTCKYRRNCKDWVSAVEGEPGLVAITGRLESAAAKSGRVFEANTLLKPARLKRAAAASALLAPVPKLEPKPMPEFVPQPAKKKKSRKKPSINLPKTERKPMPKSPVTEENTLPEGNETGAKLPERNVAVKPARPKAPANGTVYLLLSKNGKYKELREADLLKEAANIFKDSSLRLVKGQYLVPQITFKPIDE
jgi:outer membrane biosynthesis protein TonB